ncbi:MAG TPA: glycosyltransferase, partial [Phototrophicaceae bacterium]|nr:glycosyltransferase [Phototrophicaceae bacterium]
MSSKKTLLVVVSDRISDILRKGEYAPRYYNPGDLFDEVHLVLTNDDCPDPAQVQYTVGRAKLALHNVASPPFVRTLGWQPFLLEPWIKPAVQLAQAIQPTIIRTHANYFNGYLGAQIKQRLKIPLVVSLHTEPDELHRWINSWRHNGKKRLAFERRLVFEETSLQMADWVLPVYESARAYAERHGAKQVRVCYNTLNTASLRKKEDYGLHTPVRILNVNRQFSEKNPDNLIRAVARLENVELTLVGDGPYHEHLREVAQACSVTDRVIFHRAIPNSELCAMLPDFDIFAIHSD